MRDIEVVELIKPWTAPWDESESYGYVAKPATRKGEKKRKW
jgi:hypothetical protein